jgi:hypothetical protein
MQRERAKPLKDGDAKPRIHSFMAMTAGLSKSNPNRAFGQKHEQGLFFGGTNWIKML